MFVRLLCIGRNSHIVTGRGVHSSDERLEDARIIIN